MIIIKLKDIMVDEKLHHATVSSQESVYYKILNLVDKPVDWQVYSIIAYILQDGNSFWGDTIS